MRRNGSTRRFLILILFACFTTGCATGSGEKSIETDLPPEPGENAGPVVETLDNGITVIAAHRPGTRMFAMSVFAWDRAWVDSEVGVPGICDFLMRLLPYGGGGLGREEVARRLALLGGELQVADNPFIPFDDRYFGRGNAVIRFDCLGRNADAAVELVSAMIAGPDFSDDSALEETRGEMLRVLGMSSRSPRKTAGNLFYETLFAGTPFALPVLGEPSSISGVSKEDLESAYELLFDPCNIVVSVVGAISPDSSMALLRRTLGKLEVGYGTGFRSGQPVIPKHPPAVKQVCTEIPGANQVFIYMGALFEPMPARDRRIGRVAMSVLSERLSKDLREPRGLAYSVGAGFSVEPGFSFYRAGIGTSPANYEVAVSGIRENIASFIRDGVTEEEVATAVNDILGTCAMRTLSSLNQAYYAGMELRLGREPGRRGFFEALESVSAAEIDDWSRRYLDPARMIEVSAGPACR